MKVANLELLLINYVEKIIGLSNGYFPKTSEVFLIPGETFWVLIHGQDSKLWKEENHSTYRADKMHNFNACSISHFAL